MSQCKVAGCERKHNAKGYCMKHYCQVKRCGTILQRSLKDMNEIIFEGDICRIKLYNLSGNEKAEAIIDREDYLLVKNHKWTLSNNGYVSAQINKKKIGLSALILGVSVSLQNVIDHKDGNTLDNRRINLRHCSTQENFQNQGIRTNNTSGFKGVNWDKDLKKWRAQIKVNYHGKHLGCFTNKNMAAIAYNKAAVINFGEFARLNIIE